MPSIARPTGSSRTRSTPCRRAREEGRLRPRGRRGAARRGRLRGKGARAGVGDVRGSAARPGRNPDTAGGNCFVELDDRFVLDGTLAGTLDLDLRLAFHGPCFASSGEFHATGLFTGSATADGVTRTGTVDAVFNGVFRDSQAEGKLVLRAGTGGLANLHGVLVLTGTPGVGGTYSGTINLGSE